MTSTAPALESDRAHAHEPLTLVGDLPPGPDHHSFDATQGRQSGSEPYDDATQGRQIGSDPHDDATQAR